MNEEMLRRVLEDEAARVEVQPDALATIRERIRTRRPWWSPRPGHAIGWGALTAAAATAAAVAIGVATSGPPQRVPPPQVGATSPGAAPTASAPAPTASAPAPTDTAPPGASATAGAPPGTGMAKATVAVYYLGNDRGRPRLYREFHAIPVGDGSAAAKTRAAVTQMLDGRTAADPDYASGWPASATVRQVRTTGDTVTVDLTGAAVSGATGEEATLAVQQLVWTATATSGKPGVRLLLDGAPAGRLWGQVDVSGTLRRAPAADVLGLVWLVSPQHGATVGRTFEVHIAGIVFEATAHLRVRQGSRTVSDQVVTLSTGAPAQGERKVSLTLAPGTYTLEAYEISPADGSEQHLDDHVITVR